MSGQDRAEREDGKQTEPASAAESAAQTAPSPAKNPDETSSESTSAKQPRGFLSPHRLQEAFAGAPFLGRSDETEGGRARVAVTTKKERPFRLVLPHAKRRKKRDRHARVRVAFMRYGYYDVAFEFFTRQVLNAEYVRLPEATKRTIELGSRNSSDYVCTPFKHILGDYLEALELGADVLVQVTGPCRLGYYGELQESILRDMGYEFEMLNFATVTDASLPNYIEILKKKVNPDLSVPHGLRCMLALIKMIECLDEANDFYLAHAGHECEHGAFSRAIASYHDEMRNAENEHDVADIHRRGMDALRAIPLHPDARPLRVGIVGEYFTAVDEHSNLGLERKLLDLGVEVHRMLNMTHRNLHYNEKNLRASAGNYLTFDMGPTSSMTVAATLKYAQEGFDGVVHAKSSGCTPEIDCVPVLQRISRDTGLPILYLSYDSQTSDTGLDTRLEAFYDMIAMKKEAAAR